MKFELEVTDSIREIAFKMSMAIADHLNASLKKSETSLKPRLGPIVDSAIRNSKEYYSLLDGILQAEFGLISPLKRVNTVISRVIETIYVNVNELKIAGKGFSGGMDVGMIVNSGEYADLVELDDAHYKSHGYDITWLKWLLVSGSAVINNFQITYDLDAVQTAKSRSKKAIMIEGGAWALISPRVPAEYYGVPGDNFLTRSLNTKADEIIDAIRLDILSNL